MISAVEAKAGPDTMHENLGRRDSNPDYRVQNPESCQFDDTPRITMAAERGFEPQSTGPEPVVLPLDDSAVNDLNNLRLVHGSDDAGLPDDLAVQKTKTPENHWFAGVFGVLA